MLKNEEKLRSMNNGKRMILIAEDEKINQMLLGGILEREFDLLYAENGRDALEMIRANADMLALVLLDLKMPVMSGLEVLQELKEDPAISGIPVIVLTADQEAEVQSLLMGAIDFIPKPYPQADVVLARVWRTIELFEDRKTIRSTERDPLTGLYNREYFYRYAEQADLLHRDVPMDAVILDVNHFHMLNERFGTAYGDDVLRRIGEKVKEAVASAGGIVCRREADTFMVYCPSGIDHTSLLECASSGLSENETANNRVRLRMGVYTEVDKSLDIARRFDRAKMAADTVKNSFTRTIGFYDSELHEKQLYAEQLIEDFPTAIEEHQFKVYYQPKFDIRPEIPILASAEALVRWIHPRLGMISPAEFIPLFEENGLIQTLDNYVWNAAAAQVRDWKKRFDFTVPVSVNVSRIDMYDPELFDTFRKILENNDLTPKELHLEITESAYTQDSEQIIETVSLLRNIGFRIEMDDFGTGYSSLNMISTLPIDALKLDMQFIRNAFDHRKDTRLLEVIVDIADYLSVPVIAEGVETEEQMLALKAMGCDYVQGYYFSRPVPAEEYERFVIERRKINEESMKPQATIPKQVVDKKEFAFGRIAYALSSGFESIYYVDVQNHHYVEFNSRGKYEDLQIQTSGMDFFRDCVENIEKVVYEEDRERVSMFLRKDMLLSQLKGTQPFAMTYRLIIEGKPAYYTLKAVRASAHDEHHIVLGVSNVDEQIRQMTQKDRSNELDFGSLARALSSDMESIYYVDVQTGSYQEFRTEGKYKKLNLCQRGDNFFEECQENIRKVIYEDDREKLAAGLMKENLLSALEDKYILSTVYRILIGDEPVYYKLKVVWADETDRRHLIFGVSNINLQITEEEKLKAQQRSSITFSSVAQALAVDYFCIYYVNTDNDAFIEFSTHELFDTLNIDKQGSDFFALSRKNIVKVVHPDDVEMVLSVFTRENVINALEQGHTFTLTYRLLFQGTPTYVHLKANRMLNSRYIVIGVSDVDEQIRREREYARAVRLANQDALTGVKSKHAYTEEETKINRAIHEGVQEPFALAVCDVNGLKLVNDTWGHQAGDQLLKDACGIICRIFSHSPVYRVGGDEFVVLLQGSDFENREALMQKLYENNAKADSERAIQIAGGISGYRASQDRTLAEVFARADAEMYRNKKMLKGCRQ